MIEPEQLMSENKEGLLSARAELAYYKNKLGKEEYARIVENCESSQIYKWSGWPLKVELTNGKTANLLAAKFAEIKVEVPSDGRNVPVKRI